MLSEEVLKKIKKIEITAKKIIDDSVTGNYRSHFKGQGVQFSEHRVYMPGDDVRHIDWKVSARTRDPLVKKFEEERELTVLILVDLSGSGVFGSQEKLKNEVAAEVAGTLAYAATHTGDKVGALLFSDIVELTIPPKKGKHHVLRMIKDVMSFSPENKGTSLKIALDSANRVMKHAGVVFIISDFLDEDYEISLKRLARKHDVVAICLEDQRESSIPQSGLICLEDPETGEEAIVDTRSSAFQRWFQENRSFEKQKREDLFKRCQIDSLVIQTHDSSIDLLIKYFKSRSRKRG